MKYRCLNEQELEPLREEFISYLAANGMAGEDWLKITETQPKEAQVWIDQFSQVVWEKALPKIKALELRLPHSWSCVLIEADAMQMIRLTCDDPEVIVFDTGDLLSRLAEEGDQLLTHPKLKIVKGKKSMGEDRDLDIYKLIQQGFVPCSEVVYLGLNKVIGAE